MSYFFPKKLSVLAILSIISLFSLKAQTQAPDKPDFEEKLIRGDNGQLYINKSLPVYLKVSTSKGDNAETRLLKSKRHSEYTNPLHFDTEGINFIRHRWAVDPETKTTVKPKIALKYEIYADGRPPYTKERFIGAESYVSPAGKVFYGKGLKVVLDANDGVSGVKKTHFSMDGGGFTGFSGKKQIGDEGEHTIFYFSNDKVGNDEEVRKREFTVDVTTPSSEKSIQGTYYDGNILSPKAKFQLESNDNLAGVQYTYYQIDNQEVKVYKPSKPLVLNYLSDGKHSLTFYADDRVDNEEDKQTFDFYLDKIPPEVDVSIEGDKHEGKYTFISPRTEVKMTATDNKAGVKAIKYNINSQGNQTFNNPFSLPDKRGSHKVVYFGRDNVKNKSTARSLDVYMDNRPPQSSITYGNPKFFTRDTLFINNETKIRLSSKDYESGTNNITYRVDQKGEKDYSGAFTLNKEANHIIYFSAVDNVNNEEEDKESEVFVDNTPPDISADFNIEPIGTKQRNGKTMDVYPNYSRLYLGATDKKCGTEEILYSMNDGQSFTEYSSPHTLDVSELDRFKKEKFYKVIVKAKDKLGNTSKKTIKFYVGLD